MHNWPVNDIAIKQFLMCNIKLPLARIQACDFCFCLPSSALLESTYQSLNVFLQGQGRYFLLKPIHGLLRSLWDPNIFLFSSQRSEYTLPVSLSVTRNINIDLILKRHMNSLLFPFVMDKLNAKYSLVRIDLKLQAKFLRKLQFCVSVDSSALTKWKVALLDCVLVIRRTRTFFLPGVFDPFFSCCSDESLSHLKFLTGPMCCRLIKSLISRLTTAYN